MFWPLLKDVMLNEDISPHLRFYLQNENYIFQQNLMVSCVVSISLTKYKLAFINASLDVKCIVLTIPFFTLYSCIKIQDPLKHFSSQLKKKLSL